MFNVEDFQKLGKDQFEAASAAAQNFSKQVQKLAADSADYSRKSMEEGAAHLEKLLAAKSFDKVLEVQQAYAKSSYESFVAQATKMGELYTGLAKDAFKPLEAAVAKAGK